MDVFPKKPTVSVSIVTNIAKKTLKTSKPTQTYDLTGSRSPKRTKWVRTHFKIDFDHGSNNHNNSIISPEMKMVR